MDDLLGEVQRRMMCALKPQKRVILIGEQSCNEPVLCIGSDNLAARAARALRRDGSQQNMRSSPTLTTAPGPGLLLAMASAAQSGRSWLQAPEIELHQCDL